MMNHHTNQPRPGPACGSMAPLVALVVGQGRLHPEDADTLQAHLETCAYCRSELDRYRRLDDALARHFAPPTRNPFSPGEIDAIISRSAHPRFASPTRPTRPGAISGPRPLPPNREPRKRRGHQLISALSALAAVLLIAVIGLAIFISHTASPSPGKPTASPAATPGATLPPISEIPYTPGPKDVLSSIYMVSASEGWAVGSSFLGAGARDNLMLHYSGGQWKQVIGGPDNQSLQATYSALSQVVMTSATEGWAVDSNENQDTQQTFASILHYTGGRWLMQATIPNIGLSGLAMVSASEGWAVGSQGFSTGVLLHYTGGVWKQVPSPGSSLNQIRMTSSTDGWMVGASQSGTTLWHYNGSVWAAVTIPAIALVRSIAPVSDSDVWAVGFAGASGGASNAQARFAGSGQVIFAHYDGHTWTVVQTPLTGQNAIINDVFMDSSNDGWAVGAVTIPPASGGVAGSKAVYLHYTGGKWTEVSGPDGDGQLSLFMLSPSDGWAVGDNATILHYQNGAWKNVLGS